MKLIAKITEEQLSVEGLAHIVKRKRRLSEPGIGGSKLKRSLCLRTALRRKLFVTGNALLRLGAAGARPALHPGELLSENALSGPLVRLLNVEALCLQREKALVIRIVGVNLPAVQFQNARADRIEKIAVVRYHEERTAEVL